MWGMRCRGCEAKDQEIAHLLALLEKQQAQVERAQARVSEIADPGVTQRIDKKAPLARPLAPPRVQGFPGLEPHFAPAKIVPTEPEAS